MECEYLYSAAGLLVVRLGMPTESKKLPTPRDNTEWERDVRERFRLVWDALDNLKRKPTVSGATGGNAALESLISALASLGLITDETT